VHFRQHDAAVRLGSFGKQRRQSDVVALVSQHLEQLGETLGSIAVDVRPSWCLDEGELGRQGRFGQGCWQQLWGRADPRVGIGCVVAGHHVGQ
jgi:hypothetical protein